MKITDLTNCPVEPMISPEHFLMDHTFLFLVKGSMRGFDGKTNVLLRNGECCMVVRNQLQRHSKIPVNGEFEKIIMPFSQEFLKEFREKYKYDASFKNKNRSAFICLPKKGLLENYLQSLIPYYRGKSEIESKYLRIKSEELLLVLLEVKPELAMILFDFGDPEKIDLLTFMQKNYKFNVSLEYLAFLSGRSLSTFKRDFKLLYNQTPSRWLVQRRLEEAHFLLENKRRRPGALYLELGFENFSHFTQCFKKKYGYTPSSLAESGRMVSNETEEPKS